MELRTVTVLLTLGCLVVLAYDDDSDFAELDDFDTNDNFIETARTTAPKVGSAKPDSYPANDFNSRCTVHYLRGGFLRLQQQPEKLQINKPNAVNIESLDDFKIDDDTYRFWKEGKNIAEKDGFRMEEEFLKRKHTARAEAGAQCGYMRQQEEESGPNCNHANCTFTNRSFSNCTFTNCVFTNCTFINCTFSNCIFTNCTLTYCTFSNCPFTNRTFTDCTLTDCTLTNCSFINCTFTTCNFTNCTFSKRSFINCTFTTCHFNNCTFTDCSFHTCTFTTCTFSNRSFINCIFNMCTFTNCSLTNYIFNNCKFTSCIFTPPFSYT